MKNINRSFAIAAITAVVMTFSACAGGSAPAADAPVSDKDTSAVTTAAPETTAVTTSAATTTASTSAVPETSESAVTSLMPVVIPDETDESGTGVAVSGSGIADGDITAEMPVELSPEQPEDTGDVEVYNSGGTMLAAASADGGENGLSADTGSYGFNVFIIAVEPGTPADRMTGLCADLGLSVVYDYENFDMYAVSSGAVLGEEAADQLIEKIEEYDFVLMVEPDSAVSLAGAEVQ